MSTHPHRWIATIVLGTLLAIEIAAATVVVVRTRRDALPSKPAKPSAPLKGVQQ
mgnify:CR=1 FL=1